MPTKYGEVVAVPPLKDHKHTFILLHGQSSNGKRFGSEILGHQIPTYGTLAEAFPHAKFIFPTAGWGRATMYKKSRVTQWFDHWRLTELTKREELQVDGLHDSAQYVHELIKQESELVGAQNIVLGGLSNGCASSLIAHFLYEGKPLAAGIGLCGWLPFEAHLRSTNPSNAEDLGFDPFEKRNDDKLEPVPEAAAWLREQLDLPQSTTDNQVPIEKTPFFIAHGVEDEKVPVSLGKSAAGFLEGCHIQCTWKQYEGLGHWFSGDMLFDLIEFLKTKCEALASAR